MGFLRKMLKERYEEKARDLPGLNADIRMISGCKDEQTSADVSDVASFQLPDPAGRAGGACTSTLLKVLYADHHKVEEDLTFVQVLDQMRDYLADERFTQIPQLTSSKPLDINMPFHIVPEGAEGTRRAVLIAINYKGQQGELNGCQNDLMNVKEYIKDVHGFEEENITILMDDGEHEEPTYENILNAYAKLAEESMPGDSVFCHYSGHGGRLRDTSGDEDDGYDETLVPVDYQTAGQIRDDDIYETLIIPMKEGVTVTCLMDCCHSGTVLDLPYKFVADGTFDKMEIDESFDFGKFLTKFGQALNDIFGSDDD